MDLKTRLFEDMKSAMREKDNLAKELLQILRGGVLQIEKDRQITLDDAGVLEVVSREYKKRAETLKELEGQENDFVAKTRLELGLLEHYLPRQLSESEIESLVRAKIAATGAAGPRDMGRLMQALMPEVKGRADGKLVNRVVRKLLS